MFRRNFHSDNAFHMLFECPFTHDVAFQVSQTESWADIPIVDRNEDMDNIYFGFLHDNLSLSSICQLACLWWHVWFAHNKIIFKVRRCLVLCRHC